MKDAGFQNVKAERYKLPIGPWPKDKHLVGPDPSWQPLKRRKIVVQ